MNFGFFGGATPPSLLGAGAGCSSGTSAAAIRSRASPADPATEDSTCVGEPAQRRFARRRRELEDRARDLARRRVAFDQRGECGWIERPPRVTPRPHVAAGDRVAAADEAACEEEVEPLPCRS